MKPHHRPPSNWTMPIFWILALHVSSANADKDKQADVLVLALPASAYLLTLNKQDRQGAWALTKSLGLAAAGTLVLNSLIDKDAPNGSSNDAFPSGHAAIAFGSAAFIQRRYGWHPGIPAYLVAAYVGWLRIETDDHDAADVIGGTAVGIISSYLLTKPFTDNVRASAWTDGKSAGLQIRVRW
ncbi:MAG: phosphatase PAP2 family protein [Proteobacteria bacterium]|nr:phosphatase PAP2 family protein [Pseudomonadota bacterium]